VSPFFTNQVELNALWNSGFFVDHVFHVPELRFQWFEYPSHNRNNYNVEGLEVRKEISRLRFQSRVECFPEQQRDAPHSGGTTRNE
jgi:hypothetical protein